jgi:hypothetical protein
MKTSTLPPALQLISEEDVLVSKSAAPKLTYRQAVDAFFVAGPDQLFQVSEATIEQFTVFVQECMATVKNSKVCEKALLGLNYAELLDRWYALDTLRVYGATVPLYASIEAAKQGYRSG